MPSTKKMKDELDAENFDQIFASLETPHPLDDVKK